MTERHDCDAFPSTNRTEVLSILATVTTQTPHDLRRLAEHLSLHLEALRTNYRTREEEVVRASHFYVRLEEAFALFFPCPVPSCRARRGKPCQNGPPLHRRRVARALASLPEKV